MHNDLTISETGGPRPKLLLLLAVANSAFALVLPFLLDVYHDWTMVTMVSCYRELDLNGIIDHEALRHYDGGRFAKGNWTTVPEWLMQGHRYPSEIVIAISVLLIANGVALLV